MATLRAGVFNTVVAQYINFAVGFIKLAIVSRILSPEEIGTFTLTISLIFIAQVVRLFGTWDYIVAQSEVTEDIFRLCFTVVFLIGCMVAALFFSLSGWISNFFNAPDMSWLLPLMTLSFFILPFALMAQAKMTRELRFRELSIVRVAGGTLDAVVVVAMIYLGFGVESLAWGFLAGVTISTVLVAFQEPDYILFRPKLQGMGPILRFGVPSTAAGLLNSVNIYGPSLILGRFMTPTNVGFFARGQTLVSIFRQGIESAAPAVTQSWFANKSREKPEALASGYLRICEIAAGVSWPFYMFLIAHAVTLVPFLLGEQWIVSVPVTQALAFGGLFSTFSIYGATLLAGRGHVNKRLAFAVISQSVRVALLVFAALQGDLQAFAWAVAVSEMISCAIMLLFLKQDIGLSLRAFLDAMRRCTVLAGTVATSNFLLQTYIFEAQRLSMSQFLLSVIVTAAIWVAGVAWMEHPIWLEIKRVAQRFRRA